MFSTEPSPCLALTAHTAQKQRPRLEHCDLVRKWCSLLSLLFPCPDTAFARSSLQRPLSLVAKMEAFRRFPAHNAAHLSLAAPVFHRVHNKRQACTLYSAPAASSDLPVLEDVTIAWQPDCVKMGSDTIDLYLSVQSPQDGLLAVHQWKDVAYDEGFLTTQLQPSWWNASTGAGSVSAQVRQEPRTYSSPSFIADLRRHAGKQKTRRLAFAQQFSIVASDQPLWNSAAPAGPLFTITYNGTRVERENGPCPRPVSNASCARTGTLRRPQRQSTLVHQSSR